MKLYPIFVDEKSGEGLYSFQFGKGKDELGRLLQLWRNHLYVTEYCEKNREHIVTEYFRNFSIEDVIKKIHKEAQIILWLLKKYTSFEKYGHRLQHIFKPLNDNETKLYVFQKSKFSVERRRKQLSPILRLYAIRISENTYIITGGAIKLVRRMSEHDDLINENDKLEKVKKFLIENGYQTEEDLIFIL